jgi:hypothetical protein
MAKDMTHKPTVTKQTRVHVVSGEYLEPPVKFDARAAVAEAVKMSVHMEQPLERDTMLRFAHALNKPDVDIEDEDKRFIFDVLLQTRALARQSGIRYNEDLDACEPAPNQPAQEEEEEEEEDFVYDFAFQCTDACFFESFSEEAELKPAPLQSFFTPKRPACPPETLQSLLEERALIQTQHVFRNASVDVDADVPVPLAPPTSPSKNATQTAERDRPFSHSQQDADFTMNAIVYYTAAAFAELLPLRIDGLLFETFDLQDGKYPSDEKYAYRGGARVNPDVQLLTRIQQRWRSARSSRWHRNALLKHADEVDNCRSYSVCLARLLLDVVDNGDDEPDLFHAFNDAKGVFIAMATHFFLPSIRSEVEQGKHAESSNDPFSAFNSYGKQFNARLDRDDSLWCALHLRRSVNVNKVVVVGGLAERLWLQTTENVLAWMQNDLATAIRRAVALQRKPMPYDRFDKAMYYEIASLTARHLTGVTSEFRHPFNTSLDVMVRVINRFDLPDPLPRDILHNVKMLGTLQRAVKVVHYFVHASGTTQLVQTFRSHVPMQKGARMDTQTREMLIDAVQTMYCIAEQYATQNAIDELQFSRLLLALYPAFADMPVEMQRIVMSSEECKHVLQNEAQDLVHEQLQGNQYVNVDDLATSLSATCITARDRAEEDTRRRQTYINKDKSMRESARRSKHAHEIEVEERIECEKRLAEYVEANGLLLVCYMEETIQYLKTLILLKLDQMPDNEPSSVVRAPTGFEAFIDADFELQTLKVRCVKEHNANVGYPDSGQQQDVALDMDKLKKMYTFLVSDQCDAVPPRTDQEEMLSLRCALPSTLSFSCDLFGGRPRVVASADVDMLEYVSESLVCLAQIDMVQPKRVGMRCVAPVGATAKLAAAVAEEAFRQKFAQHHQQIYRVALRSYLQDPRSDTWPHIVASISPLLALTHNEFETFIVDVCAGPRIQKKLVELLKKHSDRYNSINLPLDASGKMEALSHRLSEYISPCVAMLRRQYGMASNERMHPILGVLYTSDFVRNHRWEDLLDLYLTPGDMNRLPPKTSRLIRALAVTIPTPGKRPLVVRRRVNPDPLRHPDDPTHPRHPFDAGVSNDADSTDTLYSTVNAYVLPRTTFLDFLQIAYVDSGSSTEMFRSVYSMFDVRGCDFAPLPYHAPRSNDGTSLTPCTNNNDIDVLLEFVTADARQYNCAEERYRHEKRSHLVQQGGL